MLSFANKKPGEHALTTWHAEAFWLLLVLSCGFACLCAAISRAAEPVSGDPPNARHPALDSAGTRSFTYARLPGDPLNIAFVGSEEDLLRMMTTAHWEPADPITFRSSLRITIDSLARRPYVDAPVSNLFVNGRKQDLAFEQPAAGNPSRRHHVRFWRMQPLDALGRPLWIGASTYDARIGISHTNGHVTHHIAPDVDTERDKLLDDAQHAGRVSISWVDNFQPVRQGRNGGGDPYYTDGRLAVITAEPAALPR